MQKLKMVFRIADEKQSVSLEFGEDSYFIESYNKDRNPRRIKTEYKYNRFVKKDMDTKKINKTFMIGLAIREGLGSIKSIKEWRDGECLKK